MSPRWKQMQLKLATSKNAQSGLIPCYTISSIWPSLLRV